MPFARLASGARLHYAERGVRRDGEPPVLLVHGAGGSSTIWVMAMARLAGTSYAVAIDLPGHGQSPAEAGAPVTMEGHRDAVTALAVALGLGPSVLVGHSMGALVALEVALARPEQVRGLVLCAAAPKLRVGDELVTLVREDHARFPAWMAEHGLSPRAKPAVRRGFAAAGVPTPSDVTLADFEAVRRTDLGARVGSVACPLLWLDGTDDAIVGPPPERPGDVQRLEGVGHMVPIEAPEAVAAAVAAMALRELA